MVQTNLYDTIFKRKSVRKYDLNWLDDKTISEISLYSNNVKSIFPDIKTEIRIVGRDEIKILLPIKAPHYILFYSEEKEGYLTNAGYMIQQIDLFLSSNGLGSCYLGMAVPTKIAKESSKLEFVMVLAFGNPAEPVHRTNITEFKRKSLPEITNIVGIDQLLEVARLAPSASNGQPWYFTGGNGIIHAYCVKQNIVKALLYEKMNKLDLGIALCHLAIAAAHVGKEASFVHDNSALEIIPKGYYYTASIKFL